MFLAIDIGNSSAKCGTFGRSGIEHSFRIPHGSWSGVDELVERISTELTITVEDVAISSVSAGPTTDFRKAAYLLTGEEPFIVDHSNNFGFEIDYDPPEDCGLDRLLAAAAAVETIGAPCIVCDFGTAITIDLVDESLVYRGGLIAPGIMTQLGSLHRNTAKLPDLKPEKDAPLIGNSTASSIYSGVINGIAAMSDGMIRRMKEVFAPGARVIATGGDATVVFENSEMIEAVEPYLVLEGIVSVHRRNSSDQRSSGQ